MTSRDEALAWLNKEVAHYECEDCWYSCATIACNDGQRGDKCDCGADQENEHKRVLRALLAASEVEQTNAGTNSVAGLAESQALAPSGSSNRGVAPTARAPSPAPACSATPKVKP